jgi:L-iditol 2-dehydrogenase
MQAAVYHAKQDIRLENVEAPRLAPGEVRVQVEACTVCGVDLRTFHHGDAKIAPPRILGHEFCGTVVECAGDDPSVAVGDRVIMYIVLACGQCRYCQAGRANLCIKRTTMAYHHDGAFAQQVTVPAQGRHQLYQVPEHVPSAHAALCEPLGCVLNAHSRLAISLSDTVVVIGAGPIGIMHAVAARVRGAREVIMLEPSLERLEMAKRFGFDHYVMVKDRQHLDEVARLTDGVGPSVVIVACGVAQAQADALEMAGKGARVEFFGGLPKTAPTATLNTNHLHYKELMVSGSYSEKRSDFEAAQAMIFSGRFPCDQLITHKLPLERLNEAFALMQKGHSLKVCIIPGLTESAP